MKKKKGYRSFEPCIVCQEESLDRAYHHIKSRGSGGGEDAWNRMSLDLEHHNEVHKIGLTSFAEKYVQVKNWLIENGWQLCELRNRWTPPVCGSEISMESL